jgi:hypothetical protein
MIKSLGNGPQMVDIQWLLPMIVGSLEASLISRLPPSGKLSHSPSVNFMLGWYSIIVFSLQTTCPREIVLVIKLVPFVSILRRPLTTCFLVVTAAWNHIANLFNLPVYNQISLLGGPSEWAEALAHLEQGKTGGGKMGILLTSGRYGKKETEGCLKTRKFHRNSLPLF